MWRRSLWNSLAILSTFGSSNIIRWQASLHLLHHEEKNIFLYYSHLKTTFGRNFLFYFFSSNFSQFSFSIYCSSRGSGGGLSRGNAPPSPLPTHLTAAMSACSGRSAWIGYELWPELGTLDNCCDNAPQFSDSFNAAAGSLPQNYCQNIFLIWRCYSIHVVAFSLLWDLIVSSGW